MNKKLPTLVVNYYAGPGTGKTTSAANLFAKLKWNKIRSELVSEYAKHVTWEESYNKLNNQVYLFGKQHHKQFILKDKVDVIVTDSPLTLGLIYDQGKTAYLKDIVLSEFNKFWNINIFLEREKEYDPVGRNQTEAEAIEKDKEIKKFLDDNNIEYITLPGTESSVDEVFAYIKNCLGLTKDSETGCPGTTGVSFNYSFVKAEKVDPQNTDYKFSVTH